MERICRKCLLREMDQAAYFENLYTYITQLDEEVKAPQQLYEQRLKVCKECELLTEGMCRACGCFVELKGAIQTNTCPYKKW